MKTGQSISFVPITSPERERGVTVTPRLRSGLVRLAFVAFVLAGCTAKPSVQVPSLESIRWTDQRITIDLADFPGVQKLKAHELPENLFRVYVLGKGDKGEPAELPVLGSLSIQDGMLVFEPRFPFRPGMSYLIRFEYEGSSLVKLIEFWKDGKVPETHVTAVYPSRTRLPENQLKFYLHFSAPMSRGEAYEHIQLLDAAGKPVSFPFLDLNEEHWDGAGKRFTLFFDPGRIKRGLKPREEVGPALEEGKSYTLVIARRWADAAGNPLKEEYRKSFTVGPPEDAIVDPKTWKLTPPAGGKTEPLTVRFPNPLDHALLHRMLTVTDAERKPIAGTVRVSNEETVWQFTPQSAWKPGDYRLVADTALEDLAGNSIARPFEVDVLRPVQREPKVETVRLPFQVGK